MRVQRLVPRNAFTITDDDVEPVYFNVQAYILRNLVINISFKIFVAFYLSFLHKILVNPQKLPLE